MAFEVTVTGGTHDEVIVLHEYFTDTIAEVFTFGALLNQFSVEKNGEKKNVIMGFANVEDAKENITAAFQSAKLSPFVCRMKDGVYQFNGESYKINKFYLQTEAIHGLLYDAPFAVTEKGATEEYAFATLQYVYDKKNEGFPFTFKMEVTYRLETQSRLTVITKVTNTDNRPFPLSDGWHPYFHLGETVDTLELKLNSKEMAVFDENLLPTGKLISFTEFKTFKTLGSVSLDNCFVLDGFDTTACSIKDVQTGLQLDIIPDASYPYLQIYTPADRKSIAVENLSSVPDAFNNGIGLIVLQPEESKTFTTSYCLC
ncbi:MAG: aldose 1-epimerase [Ilyomonas sp.]